MNWPIVKLGDVCKLMTGGTPSKSKPEYFDGGKIGWLVSGDIHQKEIFDCEGRITEQGLNNSNAKYLPINSVMIALNGQGKTRGSVSLLRTLATCNQSLVSINPEDNSRLLPEFLFINLHGRYDEIRKMTGDSGNDRRGLNMPLIRSIEIPLPPINEQKRIVTMLDLAFADIEKARDYAEQNLKNARELFESYLQQVFSQRGAGWSDKTMGEVCLKIQDGAHHSPKNLYSDKGIDQFLYITSKNIRNNYMDLSKIQYVDSEFHNTIYPRCTPEIDDVLLTKDGASTGNVTLNTLDEPFSLLSSVCLMKTDKTILNSAFLKYYIQSPMGFEQMTGQMTGAAIKRIILRTIKASVIPVPPIDEQKNIVIKFDQLLNDVKNLEGIYQKKILALDELKKSILQKAFTGKLTN